MLVESLAESPAEACDHPVLLGEPVVGDLPRVPPAQRHDPDALGVFDALLVEVVDLGEGELEHDELVVVEQVHLGQEVLLEDRLGFALGRAVDVDLRLDYGDETVGADALADLKLRFVLFLFFVLCDKKFMLEKHFENNRETRHTTPSHTHTLTHTLTHTHLLVDDSLDPLLVGNLNDRPHLGPEDPLLLPPLAEVVKSGVGLHDLGPVLLRGEPLVDLEERDDLLLLPEVRRGSLPLDVPVHGVLEEDGPEDPVPRELGARDYARAHVVDLLEHRVVAFVLVLGDAVGQEGLGGATAGLVQSRYEPIAALHFDKLILLEMCHYVSKQEGVQEA